MPCRDGGPCDADVARDRQRVDKKKQERLDKLTRLLCEVLTAVENNTYEVGPQVVNALVSPECGEWWLNHKVEDTKRLRAEEKAEREEKKQLLTRAEKLKNELASITKQLDKRK